MSTSASINILNGDSAAGSFKVAFRSKNDDMLIFRDVLSCGPVKEYINSDEWQLYREHFWSKVCADDVHSMKTFSSMARDFYTHFHDIENRNQCKLWLGTGLSDQLLLAFVVKLFEIFNFDYNKLNIYQFETYKNSNGHVYQVQGIGLLNPEQIQKQANPFKLTADQIKYNLSVWEAYTQPIPELIIRLINENNETMPLLKKAISCLYNRFPKSSNGLTDWDESLLKGSLIEGPKAHMIIGFSMAAGMDGLDYCGDSYLYHRLKNLAKPSLNKPLLKINPMNKSMKETQVGITEFGKLALENKVNVITENGIDDWIGGVHLSSEANNIWLRENNNLYHQNNQ